VGAIFAGVGIDDTKSVFVGWLVASAFFVGLKVGAISAGVGTADTKSVFVG